MRKRKTFVNIVQQQFATRVPKELHLMLKEHCVREDVHMRDFITEAIAEKLHGTDRTRRVRKRSLTGFLSDIAD